MNIDRVLGYDLARSLALLGMIVVHFSLVTANDTTRPAGLAAVVELLDGRAAALFVTAAGVGVTLLSRKAVASGSPAAVRAVRNTLLRRAVFLLAVGFVNLVVWPGDILRVYGVTLAVAAWLLTARGRTLLVVAAGFALGFVVLLAAFDYEKNWEWATLTYRHLWTPTGVVRNLFYDGFRSVVPWAGFLFLGMWLGRQDLRDRRTNRRVLVAGVVAAGAATTVSFGLVAYFTAHPHGMDAETITALFGTASMPPLPLFLLSAGGTAVAVIAACVRLVDAIPGRWVNPFAAAGQLALTWYFAHIYLGLGAVVAADLTQSQPLGVAMLVGVGFYLGAALLSWAWKARFRHGPLEWLMRTLAG